MFKLYRCKKCGNVAWKLYDAGPDMVCCGDEMELLKENTVDAAVEKHVPVIRRSGNDVEVSVGSVIHPMEEKHFIGIIALVSGGIVRVKTLTPGETPVVTFTDAPGPCKAYEWCNLHGLWSSAE